MEGIEHPARLTVGIVGAGRVGAVLGAALTRAGHRVTGVYAVSAASRARAETLLPGVPVSADAAAVVRAAEVVVLAVPDDTTLAESGVAPHSYPLAENPYENINTRLTFRIPVREGALFLLHHLSLIHI